MYPQHPVSEITHDDDDDADILFLFISSHHIKSSA